MDNKEIGLNLPEQGVVASEKINVAALEGAKLAGEVENTQQKTIQELETAISAYAQKKAQESGEKVVIGVGQEVPKGLEQQPIIVLPTTQQQMKEGAHKDAGFSLRWLTEWAKRVMKMFKDRFVYKEPQGQN